LTNSIKNADQLKDMVSTLLLNIQDDFDITQEGIAFKIEVDPRTVRKWIAGESAPSAYNMYCIAKAFGLSLDELLGIE